MPLPCLDRLWLRLSLKLALLILCFSWKIQDAFSFDNSEPIPDKVGAEVHLSSQERRIVKQLDCQMCKAVISEMHVEVIKHGMTEKGVGSEEQVWETSSAICLALLQKYQIVMPADGSSSAAKLEKKDPNEDEQAMMEKAASQGSQASLMRAMLVLKMGCQRWLEDYGGDTSGFVYKSVKGKKHSSAEGAADDYCVRTAKLCGSGKKKREKQQQEEKKRQVKRSEMRRKEDEREAKREQDDPLASLPKDSLAGLQRMLEMARDEPLAHLDEASQQNINQARSELQCDVCRTILQEVHDSVAKRPKSLQTENDILEVMEGICQGGKDMSVPAYFGIEPPPLPPSWTDRWRPKRDKESGKYVLRKAKKKVTKARQEWRAAIQKGQQKAPKDGQTEEDLMMTLACKDVLEAATLSERLFSEMEACRKEQKAGNAAECHSGLAAAQTLCRVKAGGDLCNFKSGKTEL